MDHNVSDEEFETIREGVIGGLWGTGSCQRDCWRDAPPCSVKDVRWELTGLTFCSFLLFFLYEYMRERY